METEQITQQEELLLRSDSLSDLNITTTDLFNHNRFSKLRERLSNGDRLELNQLIVSPDINDTDDNFYHALPRYYFKVVDKAYVATHFSVVYYKYEGIGTYKFGIATLDLETGVFSTKCLGIVPFSNHTEMLEIARSIHYSYTVNNDLKVWGTNLLTNLKIN